jgi:hypothetical protein
MNHLLAQKSIADFKKGDKAMITRGSHDSWLIMNDENEVAFLSPHSGTVNLYMIDLDDFNFIKTNKKGLLMAEYIAYKSYLKEYTPITNYSNGAMDSPEFSPNGHLIAFRRYTKDTANSNGLKSWEIPWKFSLMLVDNRTKKMDTLIWEEVSALTFLSDSTILFQQEKNDSNWLKVINIHSKEVTNHIPIKTIVRGITSDDEYILVHENLKASLFDKNTGELIETYDVPAAMQRVTFMEDYLILTPRGIGSSFMKISNGKIKRIVGSYDYEPSVSHNKEFVIVVSENFGGGIIYKLK